MPWAFCPEWSPQDPQPVTLLSMITLGAALITPALKKVYFQTKCIFVFVYDSFYPFWAACQLLILLGLGLQSRLSFLLSPTIFRIKLTFSTRLCRVQGFQECTCTTTAERPIPLSSLNMTPLNKAVWHDWEGTDMVPSYCLLLNTAKLGQVSNHNQKNKGKQVQSKQ